MQVQQDEPDVAGRSGGPTGAEHSPATHIARTTDADAPTGGAAGLEAAAYGAQLLEEGNFGCA